MENFTINVQGPFPECPCGKGNMLPLTTEEGELYWKCSSCNNKVS